MKTEPNPIIKAQMEGKPLPAPKCDHDYQRTPYHVGMCIIYECSKCGDEYEKDVS